MKKRNIVSIAAGIWIFSAPALAKTVEVKMLNKGAAGSMAFEPAYVQAGVGDTVHFVLVDKGHNATPIARMTPTGTQPAKGHSIRIIL